MADDIKVTDHAVVRFLERVHGIDMDAIRADISQHVARGMAAGAHQVRVGEATFVLNPAACTVVTVWVPDSPWRNRRRRPRDFREREGRE